MPTMPIEFPGIAQRRGEKPEAVPLHVRLYALNHRVALRGRERRRKILHHLRIGVHAPEWFAVAILPGTQH